MTARRNPSRRMAPVPVAVGVLAAARNVRRTEPTPEGMGWEGWLAVGALVGTVATIEALAALGVL